MTRGFGSDNHSGVHPRILRAIEAANSGHVPSYGTDVYSERAQEMMKRLFGPDAEAYFVFNGTAANVLSLSSCIQSHHAVLAAEDAHLLNDECGAPEKFTGAKMIPVASPDAKLTPSLIQSHLIRRGDQHYSQVKAVSITQSTELGTVYNPDEIRAISEICRKERLILHMDGARVVNAAEALGTTLKAITTDAGVDILSLGGTKNGLLFGEAVVFLRPGLSGDFKYIRKQGMQLPSKSRFLAAQFLEFLDTDLWRNNARHANSMAQRLYERLKDSPYVAIARAPEANAVFARFPKRWVARLKEAAFFYVWDEETFECRLMTTWDTQAEEIDRLVDAIARLANESPDERPIG